MATLSSAAAPSPSHDSSSACVSAGVSHHNDFIFSSLIDLWANSVGLSLETARRFGRDFSIASEIHLNAVAMGTNETVFLLEESEKRNYDFGFGEGLRPFLSPLSRD